MIKSITLSCFLLAHFFSYCQNSDTVLIVPGKDFLLSENMKSYKAKYDFISIKDGLEKKIGGLEDEFIVTGKSDGKLGLRVCNITFGANIILDSGLCALKGLKPIYHRSLQTKRRIALDFSKELISGSILFFTEQGDSSEVINYASKFPLFDSYYEDLIAKTMRFKKGLLFKFPEYIYERGGLVWSTGEVVEKLRTENNETAWKILFFENDPEGKIVRTTTYMIKENNREIISREYKTKNGLMLMKQRLD